MLPREHEIDEQAVAAISVTEACILGRQRDVARCGTGLLDRRDSRVSRLVVGIDPLALRIEIAKRKTRSNLNFRTGNAYDLSEFLPETFDVVCLNGFFIGFRKSLNRYGRLSGF
jgi:2-polyprenyl-3-methyl-5-hydroxy-6-metoxy-1,4-benzoquinol methylase